MSENAIAASEGSHVGYWLFIEMPVRRKWWQLWKPKYHFPRQSYQINAVSHSTMDLGVATSGENPTAGETGEE